MPTAVTRSNKARLAATLSVTTALSLSLCFHGSLPLLGRLVPDAPALSTLELIAYADPQLLPIDIADADGPAADPEPEGPEAERDLDAPSGSDVASDPTAVAVVEDSEPQPKETAEPEKAPPQERLVAAEPEKVRPERPRPPLSDARLRRRLAAERVAELRKLAAQRGARRGDKGSAKKGEGGRGGGEGGGRARAEAQKGDPEDIYACTADGLGKKVDVRFDRPVNDWVTVMPTVLMPFDSRPSMGAYLEKVSQVVSRRRGGVGRAGPVEFALPAMVLQMNVDEPRGVRVALGHLDGRCLVGLKYTRNLFPLTLSKVPMRVVDHANRAQTALVTITLFKDASFEVDAEEGSLPFKSGKLANAKNIAETIESHYAAARAFKEMAGWFGVDVAKMARESREERAKERASEAPRQKTKRGGRVVRSQRR